MKLFSYFEKRCKLLGVWDIILTKWSVLFFTLWIAKLFPVLLEASYGFYFVVFILLAIKPVYVFYFKK